MKSPNYFEKIKKNFKNLNLSTEKKQKVFAAAIFVMFFIGLAYVCVQQFPDINRGTAQYQKQSNFTVHISPANFNKSTARNSKTGNLFVQSEKISRKFNEYSDSFAKQLATIVPLISLENKFSVYQSENYPRIIVDQNSNLLNLPQWSGIEEKVKNLQTLSKLVDKNDSTLFFVQMPTAVNKKSILPYGIYDNNTAQIDRLLKLLQNTYDPFINVVDLRKNEEAFNKSITYANDAQLLPSTAQKAAILVAGATEKALKLDYSLDPNNMFANSNNYKTQILKNHYSGEFTLEFGERIAPKTNFSIILPKFDTKYWVNAYDDSKMSGNSDNTFSGSMKDAVMDTSLFTSSEQCNSGYLRESKYCLNINNLSSHIDNQFTALVISDQQNKAFATFFSQYVKNLTFVDARSPYFPGRISKLIKENEYDAVYVIVSDTTYTIDEFWDFDEFGKSDSKNGKLSNPPYVTHSVSLENTD